MLKRQSFKFEIMPDGQQLRLMRKFAGSCRFVYNKALALQKEQLDKGEKRFSYFDLSKMVTAWRHAPETEWLSESYAFSLHNSVKNLDRAFSNFRAKRASFPKFKKKGCKDSFMVSQKFEIDHGNSRIRIPKIGWVHYRNSRNIDGKPKNLTVAENNGKWFVSIQTEQEIEPPNHQGGEVGIDLGVTRFATFSNGKHLEPLNSFRKHESALRKAQRAMSRKTKFSSNWKKAKARVQRIHSRIGNVRRDYLHKATTAISKNHALVVIEDLQVGNMSSSGKHKRELNKSILDQGWYEFRRQLDYKTAWTGGFLVAVPPHYTSQTCIACGHVAKENRQTQASFVCIACGFEANSDYVGSVNILRAGHARLACGEVGASPSMKQEPAEETNLGLALG